MTRTLIAAVLVVAAVTAAVLLNLRLLGSGSSGGSDPVGRLSPKAQLPAAPPGVVRPTTEPVEHDGHDD